MRSRILAAALIFGAFGCAGAYSARVTSSPPELAYIEPGVGVIVDSDVPIFYTDNYYWRYDNDVWYRSPYPSRGWVRSYVIPQPLRRIERPREYARYRPRDRAPMVRDHRTYPREPEVRDHRTSPPPPVVRERPAPAPVVRERPEPTVRERPAPVVRERPAPAVRERPAPVVRERPAPATRDRPEPAPDVRDHRDDDDRRVTPRD